MAFSTINKGSSFMNSVLYNSNGTAIGSGWLTVTGFDFQPDWLGLKQRDAAESWGTYDTVRGVEKSLRFNGNNAEDTRTEGVTTFNSSGFICGSDSRINPSGTHPCVAYGWKANGAGSANTDGTINSTVSANSTSKFSIVSYTGTATAGTIGHGLGVAPKMIIVKILDEPYSWYTTTTDIGWVKTMYLEDTNGVSAGDTTIWNNTAPTSSVFSVGSNNDVNKSGSGLIAYCFADVVGYSKSGLFTGNGNANGTFVYTGFGISWLLIKKTNASGTYWTIWDKARTNNSGNYGNPAGKILHPNVANAENAGSVDEIDFLSNGFKVRNSVNGVNGSGDTHLYLAFGQPIISNGGVSATAR